MAEPAVWVFFYGSYINQEVLAQAGLVPGSVEAARLNGYDIRIAPHANLVPSQQRCVYGILATATHPELERLYTGHARAVLGQDYQPQAVLAETTGGAWRPALCYLAHNMVPGAASPDYVELITGPARRLGFPDWYITRIESHSSG